MTIHSTITPAIARACDIDFVTAATERKMADMVSIARKLKRKKMKNCEGSVLNPARKYSIMLKTVAVASLIGRSETMPANASANGW